VDRSGAVDGSAIVDVDLSPGPNQQFIAGTNQVVGGDGNAIQRGKGRWYFVAEQVVSKDIEVVPQRTGNEFLELDIRLGGQRSERPHVHQELVLLLLLLLQGFLPRWNIGDLCRVRANLPGKPLHGQAWLGRVFGRLPGLRLQQTRINRLREDRQRDSKKKAKD